MISSGIAVNHQCGICYQDGSTNTCKRCNFNLCDSCTTKFYHNVKYGTLINQCGQCKLQEPWIKPIDEVTGSIVFDHAFDIEIPSIQQSNDQVDQRDQSCCIKRLITNEKVKQKMAILFNIIMGILICECLGMMFFVINGDFHLFLQAVKQNNVSKIFIYLMLYAISGLFMVIFGIITVLCCFMICSCAYMADQ